MAFWKKISSHHLFEWGVLSLGLILGSWFFVAASPKLHLVQMLIWGLLLNVALASLRPKAMPIKPLAQSPPPADTPKLQSLQATLSQLQLISTHLEALQPTRAPNPKAYAQAKTELERLIEHHRQQVRLLNNPFLNLAFVPCLLKNLTLEALSEWRVHSPQAPPPNCCIKTQGLVQTQSSKLKRLLVQMLKSTNSNHALVLHLFKHQHHVCLEITGLSQIPCTNTATQYSHTLNQLGGEFNLLSHGVQLRFLEHIPLAPSPMPTPHRPLLPPLEELSKQLTV